MSGKRGDEDRVCLCDRPDGTCAGLAVRRLSLERVRELAEEIWTASSGGPPPARSVSDPRSSRAGASAQAAFVRRRDQERRHRRLGWDWWTYAVVGAAGAMLIGLTVGAWLAWPVVLLLAGWAGWRLRSRPSAETGIWRRQAAMQRRTAAVLVSLADDGYLVLHDVVLPGWLDSLDHLLVGPTGVWVLSSWQRRRWWPLAAAVAPPAGTLRALRRQAEALAEALDGRACVPVRPMLCVHGRWPGAFRSFGGVRVFTLGQVAGAVRAASTTAPAPKEVELAAVRLLEVLRPAA
jgi:hypothetical protein